MWTKISCLAIVLIIASTIINYRWLNISQLEGYRWTRTKKTISFWTQLAVAFVITTFVACVVGVVDYIVNTYLSIYFSSIAFFILGLFIFFDKKIACDRQPLVFTKRLIRLYLTTIICQLFFFIVLLWHNEYFLGNYGGCFIVGMYFIGLFVGHNVIIPIESIICWSYEYKCKSTLKSKKDLIVVGITGSYGKTSVKNFLNTILSQKYKTFCSPSNYNTPMGLCKTVKLMPADTQVLIAEMGARRKGDIKKLCKMTSPNYGIITGIAPQHMATFKTLENIIDTKNELVLHSLPSATVVFNSNDIVCVQMYKHCTKKKILSNNPKCFLKQYECDKNGSKLTIMFDDNQQVFHTKLIGRANIDNIMTCIAMAVEMGVSVQQLSLAIEQLKQVEHRMEISVASNGITIIDDSYNGNLLGAQCAVDCLEYFGGKKMIVAQGVVELGSTQYLLNKQLAEYMAQKAQYFVLMGINSPALKEGLLTKGVDKENIYEVDNWEQAMSLFSSILSANDVVLMQNDLTDNYN